MKNLFGAVVALALMSGTSFAACDDGSHAPSTASYQVNDITPNGYTFGSGTALIANPCGSSAQDINDGRWGLEMQSSGDLRLIQYDAQFSPCSGHSDSMFSLTNSCMRWHTNTGGNSGAYAQYGTDGNFCVRDSGGTPIWCTGIPQSGTTGAYLSAFGGGFSFIFSNHSVSATIASPPFPLP